MKTCPKCGKQFPGGVKLCPFDRTPLPVTDDSVLTAAANDGASAPDAKNNSVPATAARPVRRAAPAASSAPPNKRVCALLVDGILLSLPINAIGMFLPLLSGLAVFTIYPAFYLLRDVYQGMSPGKIFVGLQVTNDNGDIPGIGSLILRNLIIAIPIISIFTIVIEYLVLRMSAAGRRLGDRMAGTIVIDRHPERSDSTYLLLSIVAVILQSAINHLMTGS